MGFNGICVAPPLKLGFIIKDKKSFAAAIRKISDWEFERIIVTHGDIIEKNAKQVFLELCQRFLSNVSIRTKNAKFQTDFIGHRNTLW